MNDTERYDFDVVVIGAGGAGLRAAIEAREMGARTALVCKSLLGKAHTVMAEGGIAAALASVWPEDNWEVHFRDTMRGGKMLNNWRMAQIHALESPDRVLELEEWGALFDPTPAGVPPRPPPPNPPVASSSSRSGAHCSTARRTAGSCSGTSVVIVTRALPTWATARVSR